MPSRSTNSPVASTAGLSSTVEDYLKHLYAEQHDAGSGLLPMGRLAQALGVDAGHGDNDGESACGQRPCQI